MYPIFLNKTSLVIIDPVYKGSVAYELTEAKYWFAATGDSIDTHWIRIITQLLPTQLLLSEVDRHPTFPNSQSIASAHARKGPENSQKYCLWDAHTRLLQADEKLITSIDMHLTYNSAPLIIVSKDEHLQGLTRVMDIEPGTLQINTRKFWTGAQKSTHNCTNDGTLYIHMSPQCTQLKISCF